jgi:hypothetical protein
MPDNMPGSEPRQLQGKGARFWTYWISAVLSTLLFFFFMATMLMVPGLTHSTKIWMLSASGIAVAISLAIGMWRFGSTEAPIMEWPLGPTLAVVLLLELAECGISLLQLATRAHS